MTRTESALDLLVLAALVLLLAVSLACGALAAVLLSAWRCAAWAVRGTVAAVGEAMQGDEA